MTPVDDPVERARRFYVSVRQSISGSRTTWQFGIASHQGYMKTFANVKRLEPIVAELKTIAIENQPALDIIDRYDSPKTLFYCDPPYLKSKRVNKNIYRHEMSEQDHIDLAGALNRCKAKVALSGYPSELYDDLYSDWNRHDVELMMNLKVTKTNRPTRTEAIWTNYDPTPTENRLIS